MSEIGLSASLAKLTASLTGDLDVTTTIQDAIDSCADLGAAGVGVLVRPEQGDLEVLAASSHATHLLEFYQAICREGPCMDVIRDGTPVVESGADSMRARWPQAGPAIVDAGFLAILAMPLAWHGYIVGGLNIFFKEEVIHSPDLISTAHSIADIVTLAIAHGADKAPPTRIQSALHYALGHRIVVERAKGVIAEQDGVDMDRAFELLIDRARTTGRSITRTAQQCVDQAKAGLGWREDTMA